MLAGVHALLADRTDTPEIAISLDEAYLLTDRASNVLRHYSVETTQRTLDWAAFAIAIGSIYVPRAVAISIRHRHTPAAERARSAPAPVPPSNAGPARPAAPKPNGAAGPGRGAPAEAVPPIAVDLTNDAASEYET